jgi:hypothetical protein
LGLCEHKLVAGERGIVLAIAPDQRQAAIVLDYAEACFTGSPILKQLVASRNSDTLELTNRIAIEVRAASFRRLRGPTYVAVIADEAAFWYSDEFSANADVEIINACKPGLITTGGPLIIASSPYARRGVLWQQFKKHYGPDGDPLVLVARGASRDLNPSLPQATIDREYEKDAASAKAEYGAEFRTDIESYIPIEVVEACTGDYTERAPLSQFKYRAFVDPSGGSSDSFTLAIAHKEGERVLIDAVRDIRPPFSPEAVINELLAGEIGLVGRLQRELRLFGRKFFGHQIHGRARTLQRGRELAGGVLQAVGGDALGRVLARCREFFRVVFERVDTLQRGKEGRLQLAKRSVGLRFSVGPWLKVLYRLVARR